VLTTSAFGAIVEVPFGQGGIMEKEQPRRFFVTIMAPDARRLREVFRFDLDLFEGGAEVPEHSIQGLVTLDDVGRLVEAGFRVLVSDADKPKREHRFVDFDEWRGDVIADLESEQKAGA
jgi:hypothetical protein